MDRVLQAVFEQKTEYVYEVNLRRFRIERRTLDIIRKYPCRLFQIPPEGIRTRENQKLRGRPGNRHFYCVYHPGRAAGRRYLASEFYDAMKLDERIAGGFGIHYPYPDCNLLDVRDLANHFKGFGETNTVYFLEDRERYESGRKATGIFWLSFPTITPACGAASGKNIPMRM